MTVKEMKEFLAEYPEDLDIFGSDGHNWYSLDMPSVEVEVNAIVFYDMR